MPSPTKYCHMPPKDSEEWGLPEGAEDDAETGISLPPLREGDGPLRARRKR